MSAQRDSLSTYLALSVLFHGAVLALTLVGTVAAGWWGAPRYEPPESIEVAMVAMPKSAGKVPDRAARVKRAAGDKPAPEPPPVRESDLAVHRDTPDPKPGNAADALRQEALDQQRREDLLKDLLDAPEGARDRDATDPNGAEDLDLAVLGAGARGDPEVMRWQAEVQKLLMSRFQPLESMTQGRRDLVCIVNIYFDPETGEITSHDVTKPSGLLPYDGAAVRVIEELRKLPLPPEKYRKLFARDGVGIRFTPPAP